MVNRTCATASRRRNPLRARRGRRSPLGVPARKGALPGMRAPSRHRWSPGPALPSTGDSSTGRSPFTTGRTPFTNSRHLRRRPPTTLGTAAPTMAVSAAGSPSAEQPAALSASAFRGVPPLGSRHQLLLRAGAAAPSGSAPQGVSRETPQISWVNVDLPASNPAQAWKRAPALAKALSRSNEPSGSPSRSTLGYLAGRFEVGQGPTAVRVIGHDGLPEAGCL